jgi:hypothetical protein
LNSALPNNCSKVPEAIQNVSIIKESIRFTQDVLSGDNKITMIVILNGSDDGAHTELLGFWPFSIVWYSREHDILETDPVSETSCSLEYQTMEKVQKPSNSEWWLLLHKFKFFIILTIFILS